MFVTPQWLIPAWVRTCKEAGATAPADQIEETGRSLLARWEDPGRAFHTTKHLCAVLARVDELVEETHDPSLVRLAVWYHGAVFQQGQDNPLCRPGENKQASAELAKAELTALGVPESKATRVAGLVSALARHKPDVDDIDCCVLCDADLAVLAGEPQNYARYIKLLRAEYEHLPLKEYLEARETIVTKLLARNHIFHSPGGAIWEDAARQNLQVELHRVRRELDQLAGTARAS